MVHGGEAVRPTTPGSTEANIGSGAFDGQLSAPPGSFTGFDLSAVAGSGEAPVAAEFHLHHEPGPEAFAVAHPNVGASGRQLGLVDVVHDNYGHYSALPPRPAAGRGVVLVNQLPGGGAVYGWDYAMQPRPDAGHGEVLVDLLRHGTGHGVVFLGLLRGGVDAGYNNYGYYQLQPRPGAAHGEVLVPDGAGHGEAFVGQLPGGGVAASDDYVYYPWQPRSGAGHGEVLADLFPGGGGAVHDDNGNYLWQPRPGAGRDEVFIGPLPDGVGVVFVNSGSFAQQTLPGTGRADLGAGYDGSGALADDLGAIHGNPGMVAEHMRRLLPFAGIGACSVAVNGLAAGPGSPAVAFHLFVLLLGGLLLVILHVLRV